MKVLITGASGFVGSNVLQYLLNNTDWEFVALCSFRHMGNPLNIPLSSRVKVVTCDLAAFIPDVGKFDYILHLASESHVDRSIEKPIPFVENNVSSTLLVLEYAVFNLNKDGRFILFSTDEVYGARKHEDWDVLLPTNPYAASKAAQEAIAIAYFNTYKVPVIITNSNNIVGKNQHPEKFVPKLVDLISAGDQVQLHASKGKYGARYYNPVQNVASALKFILGLPYKPDGVKPPRYSIPGGEKKNNLELARMVAKLLGEQLYYKTVDVHSLRPTYDAFYAEGEDKLRKLGWKPPYSLEEGLRWIQQM